MTDINNCKCGGSASIVANPHGYQSIKCSKCEESLGYWRITEWNLNEEHVKEWNDKNE